MQVKSPKENVVRKMCRTKLKLSSAIHHKKGKLTQVLELKNFFFRNLSLLSLLNNLFLWTVF